jgi:hypothetical protein
VNKCCLCIDWVSVQISQRVDSDVKFNGDVLGCRSLTVAEVCSCVASFLDLGGTSK